MRFLNMYDIIDFFFEVWWVCGQAVCCGRAATTAAIGDGCGLFQFPRMENGNIRMNANWAGRSDRIFCFWSTDRKWGN